MKRLLGTFLLTLYVCAPAAAMPGMGAGGPAGDSFTRGDANKDGYLSWEEFQTALPSMRREAFDIIDANKDGRIARAEWDAFRGGHDKNAAEQGMGMPPAGSMPPPGMGGTPPGGDKGAPLPLITPPKAPAEGAKIPPLPSITPPGAAPAK